MLETVTRGRCGSGGDDGLVSLACCSLGSWMCAEGTLDDGELALA